MKAGVEHRVALSTRALELLASLPREDQRIFIGSRAVQPLSPMSFRRLMAPMGFTTTVHGFRATFKTWATEQTAYPPHVVEQALAHTISNAVERTYQRGDLIQKRQRLMEDWAKYCGRVNASHGEVVALRS
jgi:integrase